MLDHDALVYVTLDALSAQEVAAQIAGIADAPPSPEYARRVHRRSGGIPLLVEEVLAAEATGAAGVPDHLRDLFLTRVERLGAQAAPWSTWWRWSVTAAASAWSPACSAWTRPRWLPPWTRRLRRTS